MTKDNTFAEYCKELKSIMDKAVKKHGEFNSLHEAYGVIAEEFHEFQEEVFKKKPDKTNTKLELLQIAAMCLKAIKLVEK